MQPFPPHSRAARHRTHHLHRFALLPALLLPLPGCLNPERTPADSRWNTTGIPDYSDRPFGQPLSDREQAQQWIGASYDELRHAWGEPDQTRYVGHEGRTYPVAVYWVIERHPTPQQRGYARAYAFFLDERFEEVFSLHDENGITWPHHKPFDPPDSREW